MQSEFFIQTLVEQSNLILSHIENLNRKDVDYLAWKNDFNTWNILECVEHLNLYYEFYLPEITKQIQASKTNAEDVFKTGLLGSYFSKMILPKQQLKKMKTAKSKNPLNANLNKWTLVKFIEHQYKFISLLNTSRNVNLNKIKVKTSLSKYIKLNLGDTFQFLINHCIRHLSQIDRIQKQIKNLDCHSIVLSGKILS